MVVTDENALICDFAETYHIFNYKELPVSMQAILAVGLGRDSRIKRILSDNKFTLRETLEMMIADELNILIWQNTENGRKGKDKPKSIMQMLNGNAQKQSGNGYASAEEFEKERQRIIENSKKGGNNDG